MKTRRDELREKAIAFHRRHPEVWELFRRFAIDRRQRGFARYSARGIWHRIRWELGVGDDDAAIRLNNNYSPFYARALMRLSPEFEGFFELRRQKSEDRKPAESEDVPSPEIDPDDELDERDEWPNQQGNLYE